MLSRSGRPLAEILFSPIAKMVIKMGVSANTVTIVGTLLNVTTALVLVPANYLITGVILVTILVIFDNLDGQIARLSGTKTQWGAFLDSTMDRISDGAILLAIAAWGYNWTVGAQQASIMAGAITVLILGQVISYARARAEAIGKTAEVGIAERADRLIFLGICLFLVGLGLPAQILEYGLWVLAVLCLITVVQRMYVVYKQCQV